MQDSKTALARRSRLCPVRSGLRLAIAVVVTRLLGPIEADAQRFVEVSSSIDLVSYFKRDTNGLPIVQHRVFKPTCIMGTNCWRIDGNFVADGVVVYYFDGTNVYHSLGATASTPPSAATRTNLPPYLWPISPAVVRSNLTVDIVPSPGGHPLGDLRVNIAWLAFCSAAYLRSPGRVLPLPTVFVPASPLAFGYSAKTERFEDELGLPKKVDLFTSGAQYERSLDDPRLLRYGSVERAKLERRFPYPDGVHAFTYEVEQFTNFSGWVFPTEFKFLAYRFRGGRWEKSVGGTGRLSSIRECGVPKNVFVKGLEISVVDRRFKHPTRQVDAIYYSSTNAALLGVSDAALERTFRAQADRAPLDLSPQGPQDAPGFGPAFSRRSAPVGLPLGTEAAQTEGY